jgi:hypothetical protein
MRVPIGFINFNSVAGGSNYYLTNHLLNYEKKALYSLCITGAVKNGQASAAIPGFAGITLCHQCVS